MSRWDERDRPILEAAAESEKSATPLYIEELANALGLSPLVVANSVETLMDARFFVGSPVRVWASPPLVEVHELRLLERGLRTLGDWPPSDAFDAFKQLVEEQIAAEPDPEQRTKLKRFLDAAVDVGTNLTGNVLATLVQRMVGM